MWQMPIRVSRAENKNAAATAVRPRASVAVNYMDVVNSVNAEQFTAARPEHVLFLCHPGTHWIQVVQTISCSCAIRAPTGYRSSRPYPVFVPSGHPLDTGRPDHTLFLCHPGTHWIQVVLTIKKQTPGRLLKGDVLERRKKKLSRQYLAAALRLHVAYFLSLSHSVEAVPVVFATFTPSINPMLSSWAIFVWAATS